MHLSVGEDYLYGFQGGPDGPLAPPTRRPCLRSRQGSRSGGPNAGRAGATNERPGPPRRAAFVGSRFYGYSGEAPAPTLSGADRTCQERLRRRLRRSSTLDGTCPQSQRSQLSGARKELGQNRVPRPGRLTLNCQYSHCHTRCGERAKLMRHPPEVSLESTQDQRLHSLWAEVAVHTEHDVREEHCSRPLHERPAAGHLPRVPTDEAGGCCSVPRRRAGHDGKVTGPPNISNATPTGEMGLPAMLVASFTLSAIATMLAVWAAQREYTRDRRGEPNLSVTQYKDVMIRIGGHSSRTFRISVSNTGKGAITIIDVGLKEHEGPRTISIRNIRTQGREAGGPELGHRIEGYDYAEWSLILTDYPDWDQVQRVRGFVQVSERYRWRHKGHIATIYAPAPEWHAGHL